MANAIHNYDLRDSEDDIFIPRRNAEALKKGGGVGGY